MGPIDAVVAGGMIDSRKPAPDMLLKIITTWEAAHVGVWRAAMMPDREATRLSLHPGYHKTPCESIPQLARRRRTAGYRK